MPGAPLLVLDSATLYYRAFYALPDSMTAPDGFPHNAIRGFLQSLARMITRFRPREVIAAWDSDWRPQWRVDLIPSYKTHRVATEDELAQLEEVPDTLGPQIGAIADILRAWGVPVLGHPDAEADDVIGSLAHRHDDVLVVTSDRDLLQVVSESVGMLQMTPGGMDKWPLLDPAGVRDKFGVDASRYVDFAVLRGDPSDGLPGVRGIGEKTAAALVSAFGSLEDIISAAGRDPVRPLTPRLAAAILDHSEYIMAARQVVAVRTDLALPSTSQTLPRTAADASALRELAEEWGVTRFVDEALTAAQTALA